MRTVPVRNGDSVTTTMSTISRLEDVLAPHTIADFVAQYWGKKPLFIRGSRTKFENLYSLDQFLAVLDRPGSVLGKPKLHASFDKRGSTGLTPTLPIAPRDARAAYAAGATVCMNRLEEHEPALAALVARFRIALGYPGDMHVNAYWSPHGAGFLPHFDARIATTLQIHGSKKWRYGRRAEIAWPHDNAHLVEGKVVYDRAGARESWEEALSPEALTDLDEANLEPGDVLSIPAGTIHEALAEGSSFALNFTFNRLPVGTYLSALLAREFGARPEWRYVRPLSSNVGTEEHGPTANAELRTRLRETIAYLQELDADPRKLTRLAALELASTTTVPDEPLPSTPLTLKTEVCASPFVVVASRFDEDPLIVIVRGQKIEASGTTASLLRHLLGTRSVTVASLAEATSFGRAELLDALGDLETIGFVRRVGSNR